MDGNRRWASQRGLPSIIGHKKGVEAASNVARYCLAKKISYLTLYVFSLENFKRSQDEKSYLFDLIQREFIAQCDNFAKDGIRVVFVGDRALFPESVIEAIAKVEKLTENNTALIMQLLFCYGGQQEIVAAAREIADQVKAGIIAPTDITKELFESKLWSSAAPAPDIIIRTGGVQRLSNFLLYSSAYAELFFSPTFWPDFAIEELEAILVEYTQSKRNFGI